ncbi:GNAT family N-acetyltransferase [Pseudomonas sp.]|uniref:GNAT family N-acetyltransferase n=1 Tax=Pseudomonas sp. TaxID=306 RepID=UPI003D6F0DCC
MTVAGLSFRALEQADLPFLLHLYSSTRADEMSHSGWPADEIAAFLAMQFNAQHQYYQAHYADAEFWVIEKGGQPIGRLYLFWGPATLHIVDIALLPAFCGQGLGTALVEDLLRRADARGLACELSVESYNPAQRLYARLGFEHIGDSGVYLRLRRAAGAQSTPIAEAL